MKYYIKLNQMILEYWWHFTILIDGFPDEHLDESDGLIWHDGYWATFWYMLNTEWYSMNDKMTAKTGDMRTYYQPMDFCDE